ncbi:MAG TPA: hypothetical protein VLA19_23915, partial [Herpetosiphonaceae bacterium]|nr:hypothetical protein [Herpetosiphonaceae bacterium]
MALVQVAVVHELPIHPRELVDRLLEMSVANGVAVEKRVARGVEQAAVERRHLQRRAARVDDLEQRLQPRPERGA